MEEEICQHHNFGFCRYTSECRKNTSPKYVKIRIARSQKPATKSNQRGAGNMIWETLSLTKIVLTNISNQDDIEQIKEKVEALEKAVQQITKSNKENEQLKGTLDVLEKCVHTLTRKALSFEAE